MSINDTLSLTFEYAHNWNSAIPRVSKQWRDAFYEINLPSLWQDLLKKATPELLKKIKMVSECNSQQVKHIKLFQELSILLKQIAPPSNEFRLEHAQSARRSNNLFNAVFGGRARYQGLLEAPASACPQEYPAKGLVRSMLKRQKAADNYNSRRARIERLGFLKFDRPTEIPVLAMKDLKLYPLLNDQPENNIHKFLEIIAREDLLYFPIELMENDALVSFVFSANLFEKMPLQLRKYIEKQEALGNIRKTGRTKISITSQYMGISLFQYDRPYPAQSPLGRLFQAAYQELSREEIQELINALSPRERGCLLQYKDETHSAKRPLDKHWEDFFPSYMDLCKAAKSTVKYFYTCYRRPEEDLKLCRIFFQLAGMETIENIQDPRWAKWNQIAYSNTARLADAFMYHEANSSLLKSYAADKSSKHPLEQ